VPAIFSIHAMDVEPAMRLRNPVAKTAALFAIALLPVQGRAQTRQPTIPPPSIIEYQPRSTLVVPEHPVPRAKFPAVDFHGHPPTLSSPEAIDRVIAAMNSLNLQVMVQARPSSGERLARQIETVRAAGYADRFVFFASLDLSNVGPASGKRIAAQLEADVRAGAKGIGEIGKGFGLSLRKAGGTRLALDDPELDVVWETAERLGVPVFIHTGDPAEFFQPLDYHNERWLEMALFERRRFNDRSRYPSFDSLMAERDRLLARHPNTTWVLAHMSWYANDLARLAELLDKYPNVYTEVGAILYDLGRQPRFAREFFIRYQDRILFGKDAFAPDEYPYYWRVFETADEYFDYYRDYHAFWKLYGMDLPDEVLEKLYYGNALRIIPGMPGTKFPER
jgi:predicted TIM-barrel fold metal-dependent hydrolase